MLGKKSRPVIGILTGTLISGNKSATVAGARSSHLESKSLKKGLDFGGVVGLGLVAALEKSGEIPASTALFSRNLSRSNPIPIKNPPRNKGIYEEMEMESLEEYKTIVTCHGPNKSYTKVYCDNRTPFRIQSSSRKATVFHISPVRSVEVAGGAPPPDFLSSCNLCHKKLHGEDIYMYRGEKAFCSAECRYKQIVMDERKEKCSSEASRAVVDISTSPYTNGPMFTTGILAI